MKFKQFKELQQVHFEKMIKDEKYLFVVDVENLWEVYLNAFPEGTNEIYRERQEYDCSCCKNFIRQFGNVVVIKDNQVYTIWDFDTGDYVFDTVLEAMSEFIHSHFVSDVFVTKISKYGTDKNYEQLDNGNVITWHHFHVGLPKVLITKSQKSEASLMGQFRDAKAVFERSLNEISPEAVETVLELIAEKTLYKGQEWFAVLNRFLELSEIYHGLDDYEKHNFCWKVSAELGGSITRIRNHSIGVLLQDITEGVDVNTAVKRYENIVAPHNYKRPKAIFTKKMVERAEQTVRNLGLLNSLPRRHAILNDITVNNVLWVDRNAEKHMNGLGGVFESLKEDVAVNVNKFKNVQGIDIEMFMCDILPHSVNFDILLENRLQSNLVSLIAPIHKNAESLFKWYNNFAWAYSGNITDSAMKQRVKQAGGKVDGILRFSLQWNHQRTWNRNDYDAHCVEPNGNHIFFQNKGRKHYSTGMLDVDIINPKDRVPAVENIAWERVPNGEYHFFVHNYSHRGGKDGFDAEIEYDGELYQFECHYDLPHTKIVTIAKIEFHNGQMKILESLPSTQSSKEIWGLKTNQFHTVSSAMYSPNYWDERGVGHQHIMFMIAGCINDEQPNGFFNEYLHQELMEHKRVFEALGSKMKVAKTDDQLSGLGFSLTKKNYFLCRVDNKVYKVII